jgi:hypothetical protein
MTTVNFCFYLQNRLIQPVKQEVNSTVILPPLVFPGQAFNYRGVQTVMLGNVLQRSPTGPTFIKRLWLQFTHVCNELDSFVLGSRSKGKGSFCFSAPKSSLFSRPESS